MLDLGSLASRLADAPDIPSAAELLGERILQTVPGGAVRIYVVGPGDRCGTCNRARDCNLRGSCLHLEAGLGTFGLPPGHVERIPQTDPHWRGLVDGAETRPERPPAELAPADGQVGEVTSWLVPMVAGGEVVGTIGLRSPLSLAPELEQHIRTAALIAASSFRLLVSQAREAERFNQLLLVNDLGRKVNAILNDELLLRQAAVDIHRTFGFHNVMIFMRRSEGEGLVLLAQASANETLARVDTVVGFDEGIVGRVVRQGVAEIVDDVQEDPDFVPWFPDTLSEIAVPVLINGRTEGVLNVESDRLAAFGESELVVLETVANQLAIALENARLFGMVKEREHRYRILVESNPGAVLHLDTEGNIVFANPAARLLTGLDEQRLLELRPSFASLAAEDDRQALESAISEALRGIPRHDLELFLEREDGTRPWIQASLQPLVGEEGDPRGVVVLARDRSRERELQDRLYQSEKLGAIGALVSGVAHELNNPLAGILGFAQLLLGSSPEEWTRDDIERIETNARRCQHIVESLLCFARQARLRKRPADVNDVIESVLRLNDYQFHSDDIEVQRDFDLRIPPIMLDINRWQQVFVNLASNAREALVQSQAETRRIRFETRLEDGRVVVRVSDTGPGITQSVQQRIFEPFYTTKDAGTGLGLSICYGIVQDHSGIIELEKADGDGTVFRITLPVEETAATAEELPTPPLPARSEAGLGRRVLVVDDEPSVRDVIRSALQNHAYTVDAVADGTQALTRIRDRDYDALLFDISLPGDVKGLDVYDRLLHDKPHQAERAVFLTGYGYDSDLTRAIEDRGRPCLKKPFDIHDLIRDVGLLAAGRLGASLPPEEALLPEDTGASPGAEFA